MVTVGVGVNVGIAVVIADAVGVSVGESGLPGASLTSVGVPEGEGEIS